MTFRNSAILLFALVLTGCATPWGNPAPLLQNVRTVRADGSLSAPLADKDLSPFQVYLRSHLSAGTGATVYALETDLPEGTGAEGDYLALVRGPAGTELRYIEQSDHRPRTDRFYHRMLTPNEAGAVDAFIKAHSLAQLQVFNPLPLEPPASTEPTTEPATEPSTQPDAPPPETLPDTIIEQPPGDLLVQYRLTEGHPGEAHTAVIHAPGKDDHPAIDLLNLLARLRDAAPYTCTYLGPIPLTAEVLYADPYRKVKWVWTGDEGGALRIAVSGPVRPMDPTAEGNAEEHWLVYQEGQWKSWVEPDPIPTPETLPATLPATEPATLPTTTAPTSMRATEAAIAGLGQRPDPSTLPSAAAIVREWRLNQVHMLPQGESWWTTASNKGTMVYHYVPESPTSGMTHGFQVPTFEFDDAHFAVDAGRRKIYLIHDGQLFSLVIPEGAR